MSKEFFLKMFEHPSIFYEMISGKMPLDYQRDIMEDDSDRIAIVAGRRVGKTEMAACKILHHVLTTRNAQVLIIAPTLRQSIIIFDRVMMFVNSTPFIRKLVIRSTQTMVFFENGSSIYALPGGRTGFSIRGFSPTMVDFEEAAFIPDAVFTAAEMSLANIGKRKTIKQSTPWGKRGRFFEDCTKPNSPFAGHVYHVSSEESPIVSKKYLKEQKEVLTDMEYMQEVLGEFVEDVDTFISRDLFLSCVDPELVVKQNLEDSFEVKLDRDYYMGLDIARYGLDENVWTIVSVDKERCTRVEAILSTSGKPLTDTIGRTIELCKKYPIKIVFVDETGVGGGVSDSLKEHEVNLASITFTLKDKAEMFTHLKWMMERKILSLPGDHIKLLNQTMNLLQSYTSTGILQLTHPDRGHDDYPTSLALACLSTIQPNENAIIYMEGEDGFK